MAKPSNALIGRTRGSVGNVTFTVWKGINVLKEKAQNAYSDPSPEQQLNNEKFATIVAFFRDFMMYINAGFQASAVGMTVYNAFMKYNPYSTTVTGTLGATKVNTAVLELARGTEILPNTPTKSSSAANSLTVTWAGPPITGLPADGQVFLLAFNRTTGSLLASDSAQLISNNGFTFNVTGIGTAIATTDIYMFYVNPANGRACNSMLVAEA